MTQTKPAEYDIEIYAGADLDDCFVYKDADGNVIDLTGYNARAEVWDHSGGTKLLDMESPDSITIDGPNGTITLNKAGAATAGLSPQDAIWALDLVDGSDKVIPFLRGNAKIYPAGTTSGVS
jgi:hypothetical protein